MKIAGITAIIVIPLALGGCGGSGNSDSGPTTFKTNAGCEQGSEDIMTTLYINKGRIGTPYATSSTSTTAYIVTDIAGDSTTDSTQ